MARFLLEASLNEDEDPLSLWPVRDTSFFSVVVWKGVKEIWMSFDFYGLESLIGCHLPLRLDQ